MKQVLGLIATGLMISGTLVNAEALKIPDGRWVMTSRNCVDAEGRIAPMNDAFVLYRDQMYAEIKGSEATFTAIIGGVTETHPARIDVTSQTLSMAGDTVTYIYPAAGRLALRTDGFGEGGSCAPGSVGYTYFIRVK